MIELAEVLLGLGRLPRGKVLRLRVREGGHHEVVSELRLEYVGKDGTRRYILYAVDPEGGLKEACDIYVEGRNIRKVIVMGNESPELTIRRRGRRTVISNGDGVDAYVAVEDP